MRQIGFIASEVGEVVKYDPKKSVPRGTAPLDKTASQRATLYFKALRFAKYLLLKVGFHEMTIPAHTYFVLECSGFILEAKVIKFEGIPVAYVTSGIDGRSEIKISDNSPAQPGEYSIQITAMVSTGRTTQPVHVIIDKEAEDPLSDAFSNILRTIKMLVDRDPRVSQMVAEALRKRDMNADIEAFFSEPVSFDKERQIITG
jgi:hypothetical protein